MSETAEYIDPLGHTAQENQLLSLISAKRLPQTLLLHGPQGIGKMLLAQKLACYLLAGGDGSGGLFGDTSMEVSAEAPTTRRVLNGSHADYLRIEPEFSGQNQTPIIKVDAARQIATFFSKTAAESPWRIAVINGADALNVNAANALLKSIEEPPLNGLLILIAHQPGKLLPTLLSRCRKIAFSAPDKNSFSSIIQSTNDDISSDTLHELYLLSAGAPGQATQLHSREMHIAYRDLLSLLSHYPRRDIAATQAVIKRVEKHAKSGGWGHWSGVWLQLLSRLNLAGVGALSTPFSDDEPAILQAAYRHKTPQFWLDLSEHSRELLIQAHGLHLDRKAVIQSLISTTFSELELAA